MLADRIVIAQFLPKQPQVRCFEVLDPFKDDAANNLYDRGLFIAWKTVLLDFVLRHTDR